jgi:hypothetical protein
MRQLFNKEWYWFVYLRSAAWKRIPNAGASSVGSGVGARTSQICLDRVIANSFGSRWLSSLDVSCAGVLSHHPSIFVFEDVAMIHEGVLSACLLRELDQQLCLALHQYDVLPTRQMIGRRLVVQGEDPEECAVDVERMRHSDGHDFPDLRRSQLRLDVDPVRIVRTSVDPDDGWHVRLT